MGLGTTHALSLSMTRAEHSRRPNRESVSKRIGAKSNRRLRERANHRCVYCGAIEGPMHLDHIIPRSQGGSDAEDNLVLACASCNSRRQDMSLHRYARYLREQLCWTGVQTTAMLRRVRRQLAS